MRTITISGTDIVTSPIGMGLASLGSRISRAQGLRALDAAFDAGITWYDVAPAYGAGEAEGILSTFIAARRSRIFICSKVGLAPPQHNGLIRGVYGLGRPLIGMAQGLRRRFRQVGATRNQRIPLTGALIEQSLTRSLSRLGVDYLDVFALHDPDPADLARDDVLAALECARSAGQARHISVAGTFAAALSAADHPVFDFFQLADDPAIKPLVTLKSRLNRPVGFVTHSVLGIGGAKDKLVARLRAAPHLNTLLAEQGCVGSIETMATQLLMRRALASNLDGVVLASMFSAGHLSANASLASQPVDTRSIALLDRLYADDDLAQTGQGA